MDLINLAKKQKILSVCMYCRKAKIEKLEKLEGKDHWLDIGIDPQKQEPELPPYSHGLCGRCLDKHFPKPV